MAVLSLKSATSQTWVCVNISYLIFYEKKFPYTILLIIYELHRNGDCVSINSQFCDTKYFCAVVIYDEIGMLNVYIDVGLQ